MSQRSINDFNDSNKPADGTPELRVKPVQNRALVQLEKILSSAAEISDEVGAEFLTTAEVAKRAGCSIGTVYRMFPDKHLLFQHIASRNIDAVLADIPKFTGTTGTVAATTVEALLTNRQTTPGYRSLQLGGSIRGMDRNGYMEIAKVVIAAAPESSAEEEVVEAALRGVEGILSAELEGTTTTELATTLLEQALAA